MALARSQNLIGLLPSVDARKIGKQYIIDGKNFRFDIEGPLSGFGNVPTMPQTLINPINTDTFRVGDRIYLFTEEAVFDFDPVSLTLFPLFVYSTLLTTPWPWTAAIVGDFYYFCHISIGVIRHDFINKTWSLHTPAQLPSNPVAITQSRGRLVVLGSDLYGWSALSNGDNFIASSATGAGAQDLEIIGGVAFNVREVANGFLVYTDRGIAVAEFATGITPYHHRVLTVEDKPISPFSIITQQSGVHTFLDSKGLRQTDGTIPVAYQALFSEFITRKLFPLYKPEPGANVHNFRLQYFNSSQLLILSTSIVNTPGLFNKTYVLYIPKDDGWGSFDEIHYGFLETSFDVGSNMGISLGFIDGNANIRRFSSTPYTQKQETTTDGHLYRTQFEYPVRVEDNVNKMPTNMRLTAVDESDYFPLISGWYVHGTTVNSLTVTLLDLDSEITFGPFRFTEAEDATRLGEVQELVLGMEDITFDTVEEDWNEDGGEEDWNLGDREDADWGFNITADSDYSVEVIGVVDGQSPFDTSEAILEQTEGSSRVFSIFAVGLYHNVRVFTKTARDSYHLKSAELTGNVYGEL